MDKFTYYITDAEERVYPSNDVKYSYVRETGERYVRLKVSNSLTFQDRLKDGTLISDYAILKAIESDRYTSIKIYKLQSNSTYSLIITGILDLTGEWDVSNKSVSCSVITNDDYDFVKKYGSKKFNVLQFGLTATTVKHTVTTTLDTDIDNTYLIQDILEVIFQNIFENASASITSQFLTSATNPVTGVSSETTKIYICHKESVQDTASSPEVLELSFDDIMKYLNTQFNLNYYVSGNSLIVESLEFFENNFSYASARTVGVDLTSYTNNGKSYSGDLILNKHKYKYDNSKIVSEEQFAYQEWKNKDFKDASIIYDVNLIEEAKSIQSINVSNDINYILDNSDISSTGVCFLATEYDSPNYVLIERNITVSSEELEIITNFNFDTLLFSKNNITSAIATGISPTRTFHTNNVQVSLNDSVLITFNLVLNSGTLPEIKFMNKTYQSTVEGANSFTFISVAAGNLWWYCIFRALAVTNFSITNLSIIKTSATSVVNAPMAWTDLLDKYHQHGRIFITGKMNGITRSFASTIKHKIGMISTVPINSLDTDKLIKTDIGSGELISAPHNSNDMYDLEVGYDN